MFRPPPNNRDVSAETVPILGSSSTWGAWTELAHRMSSRGGYAPAFPLTRQNGKTINMFDHHKVELNWGGQPLTLETGKIARQADGAVLATLGETVVLATVVSM